MTAPVPISTARLELTQFGASVCAGFPSPAADHTENQVDLNEHLMLNPAASFLFRVKGDSMVGAGIFDGDTVIVDRSIDARHGQIVLAVVDGEFTIKRLHRKRGQIRLEPENPAFSPIVIDGETTLTIWGVATTNLRRLLER